MKPLLARLDYLRAVALDSVSFGFVNLLQAAHPPPGRFSRRWDEFSRPLGPPSGRGILRPPVRFRPAGTARPGPAPFPQPLSLRARAEQHRRLRLLPCAAGWAAPTMLLAHGLMSVSDIGYKMWARRLNARGWNAIFVHLPFHYSRRLPGHFHGEYSVGGELLRCALGVRQSGRRVPDHPSAAAKKRAGNFSAPGGRATAAGSWRCSAASSRCSSASSWSSPSCISTTPSGARPVPSPCAPPCAGSASAPRTPRAACAWPAPPISSRCSSPRRILIARGPVRQDRAAGGDRGALPPVGRDHFACFPQGHVGYTLHAGKLPPGAGTLGRRFRVRAFLHRPGVVFAHRGGRPYRLHAH